MVHEKGEHNKEIHKFAWNTLKECVYKASQLKLYVAGQNLLKTAFSGNVHGMGPGVAEMEIEERASDPIVVFAADKTSAGSFNYPLFRIFVDPKNTASLVIDQNMLCGFKFEVIDTKEDKSITLKCPEEMYELLALIGTVGRYVVSRVWRTSDNLICATSSVGKLSLIAGKYVGKDDPVMIARAQHGLPAVGEVMAPFSYFVQGWMRGSHWGPVMPVGLKALKCPVFDGPPRIVAIGFQVGNGRISCDDEGKPIIADLLDDSAFASARREAIQNACTLRNMSEFEPASLSSEDMEYTTIQKVLGKLGKRFKLIKD
jgi:fructose 1,6-bisphosphate aldolase/phosphatase